MTIFGTAVVTFAMIYPLNRMVGRTFIPEEDMGEMRIHLDMPEGTAFEGTTETLKDLGKGFKGLEGVRHIQYEGGAGKVSHGHRLPYLRPLGDPKVTSYQR